MSHIYKKEHGVLELGSFPVFRRKGGEAISQLDLTQEAVPICEVHEPSNPNTPLSKCFRLVTAFLWVGWHFYMANWWISSINILVFSLNWAAKLLDLYVECIYLKFVNLSYCAAVHYWEFGGLICSFLPLGCQIILKKEYEGMELQLPQATRNFYVDGHKPKPHWRGVVSQHGAMVALQPAYIGSTLLSLFMTSVDCSVITGM